MTDCGFELCSALFTTHKQALQTNSTSSHVGNLQRKTAPEVTKMLQASTRLNALDEMQINVCLYGIKIALQVSDLELSNSANGKQ